MHALRSPRRNVRENAGEITVGTASTAAPNTDGIRVPRRWNAAHDSQKRSPFHNRRADRWRGRARLSALSRAPEAGPLHQHRRQGWAEDRRKREVTAARVVLTAR